MPDLVGVPVIAPVEPLIARPAGKAPIRTLKVYGDVPADDVTVWLYGVPTVPPGSVCGETGNVEAPRVVNVRSWLVARFPPASLELTLK